jgi:hypothetical protein
MKIWGKLLSSLLVFVSPLVCNATLTINPDAVKRATVFIFAADPNGNVDQNNPSGTGFLVSIPMIGSGRSYIVLMTARHIVDPAWTRCGQASPAVIYVRVNHKIYDPEKDATGVSYVKVVLRNTIGNLDYVVPKDDQVDAAAIPLKAADFSDPSMDLATIPLESFATDEELNQITTGDPIVSAGLVPGTQGINRNFPVFKFGFISENHAETFSTSCGPSMPSRLEKVWFISINLFPGASGSAIFYAPPGSGGVRFGAPVMRPVLIGIQSSSIIGADVSGMTSIGLAYPMLNDLHLQNADFRRGLKASPPQ